MEHTIESPWRRKRVDKVFHPMVYATKTINYIDEPFYYKSNANKDVNIDAKRAALKVSASVVSLVSRRGEEPIFMSTGIIIDCIKDLSGTYTSTILTSASLLGSSFDDIKVEVGLFDGRLYEGLVVACDLHYNLAIIHIRSDASLPIADLRLLNDDIDVNPRDIFPDPGNRFQILPHKDNFNLSPGVMVVAIGRLHAIGGHHEGSRLMVAPGNFSLDCCELDSKELMRASCIIAKCGVGGPLVNYLGEVIGVNFIHEEYTPFIPSNIVSQCLEHFKEHGRFCRPWLGMEVANLYSVYVNKMETIIQNFPNIFKGVIVEEVIPGSPADCAGILSDDVIVKCNETFVRGFLEFFGKIWDKVGESVELAVIRKGSNAFLKLTMVVDETSPDKFNSWPLPEECDVRIY